MLGVYTIVETATYGWLSLHTLGLGGLSIALLAAFVARQATARNPLLPLSIFRSRNITGANIVAALLMVSMSGMFFLGALFLQRVLGYDSFQTGTAFLPVLPLHRHPLARLLRPPEPPLRRPRHAAHRPQPHGLPAWPSSPESPRRQLPRRRLPRPAPARRRSRRRLPRPHDPRHVRRLRGATSGLASGLVNTSPAGRRRRRPRRAATLAATQLALPHIRAAGRAVINLTSDAAIEAYEGWGTYGTSKAALDRLTAVLANGGTNRPLLGARPRRHQHAHAPRRLPGRGHLRPPAARHRRAGRPLCARRGRRGERPAPRGGPRRRGACLTRCSARRRRPWPRVTRRMSRRRRAASRAMACGCLSRPATG